ncbi:MAG: DUF6090 family protein [Bacteroidota bacterium]
MIKFFHRLRLGFLSEGKFSKYLLYAIGEIILVMIGILLALQVNNWNTEAHRKKEIRSKYARLVEELNNTKVLADQKAKLLDSLIVGRNLRSLHLLSLKNEDSIKDLYQTLRGMTNVITVSYEMPACSEFIEKGYISEIENEDLKQLLVQLKRSLAFGTVVDDYAKTQLNTLIEPYAVRNLNYAEMVKGSRMKVVNATQDYTVFFNDLELENLINLKLETDVTKISYLNGFSKLLQHTASEISMELQEEKAL